MYLKQETPAFFISPVYEDYNNFLGKNMESITLIRKYKSRLIKPFTGPPDVNGPFASPKNP